MCCSVLTEPGCRVSARSEMTSRRRHRPVTRLQSLCRQASQPLGTFQNSRGRFRSGVSGSAGITAQGFAPTESPSMPSFKHAFHLVSRAPLRCPPDHGHHPCLRLLASNPSALTLAAAEIKRGPEGRLRARSRHPSFRSSCDPEGAVRRQPLIPLSIMRGKFRAFRRDF
jgi:hypothetical protein